MNQNMVIGRTLTLIGGYILFHVSYFTYGEDVMWMICGGLICFEGFMQTYFYRRSKEDK